MSDLDAWFAAQAAGDPWPLASPEVRNIMEREERKRWAAEAAAGRQQQEERSLARQVEALSKRLAVLERTPERARQNARKTGFQLGLVIKSIGGTDDRSFEGTASHADLDLVGDEVVPSGARYSLPLPLLLHHHHDQIVGTVTHADIRRDEIRVRAKIATIPEGGVLKELVDSAWQSVKYGLLRSLSIGFMPIKTTPIASGLRITQWQWLETSLVACPANLRCTIGSG